MMSMTIRTQQKGTRRSRPLFFFFLEKVACRSRGGRPSSRGRGVVASKKSPRFFSRLWFGQKKGSSSPKGFVEKFCVLSILARCFKKKNASKKIVSKKMSRVFPSIFSVAHAYQKLLEFGVDSCEGLRLERDVKGLADDIGVSATDATALENAHKSLLLKAKTTKETQHTTFPTTATARDDDSDDDDGKRQKNAKEDAIERAKREAKRRRENTWSDDTTHETKRTFLERALLEPDDDAPSTKSEDRHGKIEAAMAKHIEPYGETEVKIMTTLCEETRLFKLFKLPEAPVDALTGKCEWRGHPATNGNAVLLESKLMQMRLMKTKEETRDEGLKDACEKCAEEIKKATRFFSDQKVRNSILKKEVERRVEELKSEGNVDLDGGYVTATGIHYGTGAAAAAAKEAEEALYDGHGPSASSAPGARLPPSNDGAGKIDRLYDDITTETHRNNSKTIEKEGRRSDNADREVDLEAIRNKLKRKKPKFL